MYKGFTSVSLRKPQRSEFDLDHEKKLSTRMGKLIPIFVSETMPNDTFKVNSEVMMRLAPMLAPVMHRINVFVHYFFVPNRLLWSDWETFITGGRLGEAVETPPIPPRVPVRSILEDGSSWLALGSLADYMGINPIPDSDAPAWNPAATINMLPFAAYYKVYQDYYRDRNYEADTDVLPLPSGTLSPVDWTELMVTRTRKWGHDYFTSALPFTQRGQEVLMPLQGTGTVTYLSQAFIKNSGDPGGNWANLGDVQIATLGGALGVGGNTGAGRIENIDEVTIDASSVSINDLRRAVRLQEWLERNALAGSRYNESIMAHFGRKTSDSRLQRAEYLGGGRVPVQISEVVNTAFSEDADANVVPAGNMSGHGISYGKSNYFKYNCEEHGFVIGIMSVMPKADYMQGTPRMFTSRNTFLDYPWPSFAHLGEQEVYTHELYFASNAYTGPNSTLFGYQSRYADWKYMANTVHGDFRTSLDFWHLARKFSTEPILGADFVSFEDDLQNRIFAVQDVDVLWCYIYNRCRVVRSLPYYGTPML